jgi:hypothetical protein
VNSFLSNRMHLSSNLFLNFFLRSSLRSNILRLNCRAAILSASLVLLALPAFAGLGEDSSSVDADQAHMQGERRITQASSYSVHEIKAPTGTIVREYVSASGQVFGVAWQGPLPPNMQQILAGYFETYRQASEAQTNSHTGRRPLVINQPELVVRSGGHMRAFAGQAYVPALLPKGVTGATIQ